MTLTVKSKPKQSRWHKSPFKKKKPVPFFSDCISIDVKTSFFKNKNKTKNEDGIMDEENWHIHRLFVVNVLSFFCFIFLKELLFASKRVFFWKLCIPSCPEPLQCFLLCPPCFGPPFTFLCLYKAWNCQKVSWLPTPLLKVLTSVFLRTCQKPLLFDGAVDA